MTTTEKNRIIAEFMQYDGHMYDTDLKYHSDWNWIFSVVEKIENLGFTVTIAGVMCKITKVLDIDNSIVSYVLGDKSRKLELVYITISKFIQWYNQNKEIK
jgi:hypothetical protein